LLERAQLADGRHLIVKRFDPRHDLVMRITHDDVGREYALWRAGALDGFPPGVAHPIVAGWVDGDATVLVMRDLGDTVLGWDRILTRDDCRRIFAAMIAVHRSTALRSRPDGLCPLETRVGIFAPQRVAAFAGSDNPVPGAIEDGWERFHHVAEPGVAAAVAAIHENPALLAGPLGARPGALLHADLWLVNIALAPDEVTFFDWGLATWAPSWLEMTMFLIGAMSNTDATYDELLADYRELSGNDHDDTAMRLALLCTLCDLGWNKALDATEHSDPAKRAHERSELDWWSAQARQTLDAGLVEIG
jgi:hypothetical protein